MKNFAIRHLLLAFMLISPLLVSTIQAKSNVLHFLSWSEYIDPDVVKAFEQKYKVKIQFTYFKDDDDRDAIMVKSGGRGYDLIIVNGVSVKSYKRHGWLSKLSSKDVPNIKHIDRKWMNAFKGANGYTLPYFWGTTGIAYRKDIIKEPISSWTQLFNPSTEMQGKIIMLGVSRDVIGMALKSLGYSANSVDFMALNKVENLLKSQKPHVKTYSYMTLDKTSPLVTGDAVIAMAFSGDALMMKEHNENIEYVLPKEGGNLWVDYLAVLEASNNKVLAKKFIDFVNSPEMAAKNANFVYYATPNKTAKKLLSKEFLSDPVIYPPKFHLDKSEFDGDLPVRIIKKRNQIMAALRHK